MRYEVIRTSSFSGSPCEEALLIPNTPNNRSFYYVEFNSQEELLNFIKKYEQVVIEIIPSFLRKGNNRCEYRIEIYDDCRE